MTAAQERARNLAREIQETMKVIKDAEARMQQRSRELKQALMQVRAEAEVALTVVEYPTGRYECAACGQGTLFTAPVRGELPVCDNCGQQKWVGHEPKITRFEPPPPKRYPAGMYQCTSCEGRTIVVTDTDELSPCELCGGAEFRPMDM